ncbi:hypothetical protein BCT06_12910 [Vibrio breoganii]|uniref:hypothetical protein n=1 Tax=Vibrio breoganii TaxID=553239 RepID=UPI000C82D5D5|nr:hypothetical protein [Vibrio breoganii]PML18402.1 hypothetical protein BCT84_20045 [Vibrio breoganii]PMO29654.1 hypothetical protein BCT12_07380 [Vibrio breoganii]PMO60314.1 hypothetical protein BCT06_12910 [Vibrio breoganii]
MKYVIYYIVVFLIVLLFNQLNYGACFAIYCLEAAIPKVSTITSIISVIALALIHISSELNNYENGIIKQSNIKNLTSNSTPISNAIKQKLIESRESKPPEHVTTTHNKDNISKNRLPFYSKFSDAKQHALVLRQHGESHVVKRVGNLFVVKPSCDKFIVVDKHTIYDQEIKLEYQVNSYELSDRVNKTEDIYDDWESQERNNLSGWYYDDDDEKKHQGATSGLNGDINNY